MVEQGNRKAFSTFSSLQRFAQEESEKAAKEAAEAAQEHCDLCGEPIPPEHRHLFLEDFEMSDVQWERLRIPVDMAFFFYSTPAEKVVAFYPSPMGPTESLLKLNTWEELEKGNPVLKGMERDVEALLVNRVRGAREHFLVPMDECYSLVGLIRMHWRGLSGDRGVWEEIGRFFEELRKRSKTVHRGRLDSASPKG